MESHADFKVKVKPLLSQQSSFLEFSPSPSRSPGRKGPQSLDCSEVLGKSCDTDGFGMKHFQSSLTLWKIITREPKYLAEDLRVFSFSLSPENLKKWSRQY